MQNSTLAMMQEIESAAQAVLDDYQAQITNFQASMTEELEAIGLAYDQETKTQVAELEQTSEQELVTLRENIATQVSNNEDAVRHALTHKKDALVQVIVDKVVTTYGH